MQHTIFTSNDKKSGNIKKIIPHKVLTANLKFQKHVNKTLRTAIALINFIRNNTEEILIYATQCSRRITKATQTHLEAIKKQA